MRSPIENGSFPRMGEYKKTWMDGKGETKQRVMREDTKCVWNVIREGKREREV